MIPYNIHFVPVFITYIFTTLLLVTTTPQERQFFIVLGYAMYTYFTCNIILLLCLFHFFIFSFVFSSTLWKGNNLYLIVGFSYKFHNISKPYKYTMLPWPTLHSDNLFSKEQIINTQELVHVYLMRFSEYKKTWDENLIICLLIRSILVPKVSKQTYLITALTRK